MKKTISFALLMVLVFSSSILLAGCGTAKVNNISLSDTTVTLEPGKSYALQVIVSPENAKDQKITWTSTDYTIVNVVDGTIYAIADGSATIDATTSNGKTASCSVFVETPTAYNKLNKAEKGFFDTFLKGIKQFKNPGSVSVVNVDYQSAPTTAAYVAKIKATNSWGGTTSDTYYVYSFGIIKGGYISSSGADFDVAKINAAIKEYIQEQGW